MCISKWDNGDNIVYRSKAVMAMLDRFVRVCVCDPCYPFSVPRHKAERLDLFFNVSVNTELATKHAFVLNVIKFWPLPLAGVEWNHSNKLSISWICRL